MELRALLETNGVRPQPALVGFSGGADSTALLLLLRAAGWEDLLAVHFNHHLRGSAADEDQRWCEEFCRRRGIAFRCMDLFVRDAMRRGESIESAARRCRIEAWRRLLDAEGRRVLFLGHHADDRLEELFLRLGRGSNATGLTSLRVRRDFDGGRLVLCRPLLEFRKSELEAYLRANGVADWRIDATNLEECCRRNAIRNRLLPLIREVFGGDAGFRQSLRVLTEDANALEALAERSWKEIEASGDDGMAVARWRTLDRPILQRLLRLKWTELAVSAETVERLHAMLRQKDVEGLRLPVGGGRMLLFRNGRMMLESAHEDDQACRNVTCSWRWREEPSVLWRGSDGRNWRLEASVVADGRPLGQTQEGCWCEFFSERALPDILTLRSWCAGDRIRPFGAHGHHRKIQDVFSDAHIRGDARTDYPLLLAGMEILWLPSLVRAEIGRVVANDRPVVCVCARRLWPA